MGFMRNLVLIVDHVIYLQAFADLIGGGGYCSQMPMLSELAVI